jgi:hypothetical protein
MVRVPEVTSLSLEQHNKRAHLAIPQQQQRQYEQQNDKSSSLQFFIDL